MDREGRLKMHPPPYSEILRVVADCGASVTSGRDLPTKLLGRAAEDQCFGAIRKIPYAVEIPMLENERQDRSVFWL